MPAMEQAICDFGWKAPDFSLRGTDGKTYSLDDVRGPKGTVVMFICNHCPYVKAIQNRLVRDFAELADLGIAAIAIMSNDPTEYPEDSFENMKKVAAEVGYPFPYVIDETQAVGRAYDARCTPDFFGFDAELELQYRGRLDASRNTPGPVDAKRELVWAMKRVAETGKGPADQIASVGCSIKWRKEGASVA
ncbi:MAG: thioredoxin family protein [Rhodospirillales bacterium]|jgi:peroxiredoxin|nr:thioredoxin family protein [Rhodospirillales bacterium]MDP6804516.1 thioredoxin family protein [Rhodospirillales bacterium]